MYRAFRFVLAAMLLLGTLLPASIGSTAFADTYPTSHALCQQNSPLCTEVLDSLNYNGVYTGHDEPSLLFYSNKSGSGNNNLYQLTLPMDPPTLPKQDGTGGTFNFQLHPAFWFGMAMCDDQSAPNPGGSSVGPTVPCKPDSDQNIYDSSDVNAPDYIGKHPGSAFMEMQFYPPGWAPFQLPGGISCDATKWCAALNIDSLSENMNTGQFLNDTCTTSIGGNPEYVNFAFITKDGKAQAPANPVDSTPATFTPDSQKDLFMNSGDKLSVLMHDTPDGFEVVIRDLTTGESGSMKASAANSFGQIKFAPNPSTECTNIPSDFHPMYSTSSEHTRVPWAAHSYNIAFSDEIGHFEYCNATDSTFGCAQAGVSDPGGADADDFPCLDNGDSLRVQITGCTGTDVDFDGPEYQNTWPGTFKAPGQDKKVHPTAVLFTSPLFRSRGDDDHGDLQNFERAAFETDLPRVEFATNPPCQRHVSNPADPNPGAGCVNPPVGANFYPIYTTRKQDGNGCAWQLGGVNIPGTKDTFGGNSTAEYGPLLLLAYPAANGTVTTRYNNFRQVLSNNPCNANESSDH